LATIDECKAASAKFPEFTCNVCEKPGHVSPNCPERFPNASERAPSSFRENSSQS
jgi:hypothetical protein